MNETFWQQLETQKLTKDQIETYLTQKLGSPTNQLSSNLLFELTKKIQTYYFSEHRQSQTTYSMLGFITEIQEKKFKEGKRRGQTFYSLKLGEPKGEKFRALQEDLPPEKWTQITQLAILGKNLVFKYKFWLTNKDLLDFYPHKK